MQKWKSWLEIWDKRLKAAAFGSKKTIFRVKSLTTGETIPKYNCVSSDDTISKRDKFGFFFKKTNLRDIPAAFSKLV